MEHSRPVALITGAAGGLGGAIARALASAGFDLVLTDREPSAAFDACKAELEKLGSAVHLTTI